MKKIILSVLHLFLCCLIFGQNVEEQLKSAEKNFKQNNLKEAIWNLEEARNQIENDYLNSIKSDLLPAKILGYSSVINNMDQSYMSGNRMHVQQVYERLNKEKDQADIDPAQMNPMISIQISNSPEQICDIVNAYSNGNSNLMNMIEPQNPIIFKGYRAIVTFNNESNQGRFSALIGGAVIQIIGENIENKDILKEIANSIDINSIIKYFGK